MALIFLSYDYFEIWPWESMVKILRVVERQSHVVGSETSLFDSFLVHIIIRPCHSLALVPLYDQRYMFNQAKEGLQAAEPAYAIPEIQLFKNVTLKVSVMAKVKTVGYIWTLLFKRYVHFFSLRGNRIILSWDIANSIFDLENPRSFVRAKVKTDGQTWSIEFNRCVTLRFSFRGNRIVFGWDIANFMFELENSWSRLKSTQS